MEKEEGDVDAKNLCANWVTWDLLPFPIQMLRKGVVQFSGRKLDWGPYHYATLAVKSIDGSVLAIADHCMPPLHATKADHCMLILFILELALCVDVKTTSEFHSKIFFNYGIPFEIVSFI